MSDQTTSTPPLEDWLGREETRSDRIDPRQALALAATLDQDQAVLASGELPPLWHWVYFTPAARQSELGRDGHPARGGFLPPVTLPNRMWAGGRLAFHRPLRLDETVTRHSRIVRCERKGGRHGDLVFVTVHHALSGTCGLAIEEEHDIVYCQPNPPGTPLAGEPAPVDAEFRQRVSADAVLLFRYSALTFNAHRIHYDHPYATRAEGYPGLVVHGPLIATLLLENFRRTHPGCAVRRFAFRAVGPLYDQRPFDACGRIGGPGEARLWTDCDGRLTMKADLQFER